MLSISSDFNFYLCGDPVTLRYHISRESFVYLVEGIVPKDRRVDFNDLDDENNDETPLEELGNRGEKTSGNKLSKAVL